jgi:hypothetical protein
MANTRLTRAAATPTSTLKATMSFWIKRSALGSAQLLIDWYTDSSNYTRIAFNDQDVLIFLSKHGDSVYGQLTTNRKLRDTNAWYNIIVAVDTTQATDSNRMKMYINGVQETSFSTATYPGQNTTNFKFGAAKTVGANGAAGEYFDGSMSHINYVDGSQELPTVFGSTDATSGIWKAKSSASVTYGTNGFFLKMENSGAMGTDSSGNSNTFTVSGTLTQNVDTPDNNFATFNPLFDAYSSSISFNNGNLRLDQDTSGWGTAVSSLAVNTGKWYAEFKATSTTSNGMLVGIVEDGYANNLHYVGVAGTIGYHYNGEIYNRDNNTSFGNSYAQGDIIGVAMDLTNGYVYFSKNGTFQNSGVPTSGATGTGGISIGGTTGSNYFFGLSINASGYHGEANFGQGYFGTTAVTSANADGNGVGKMEYAVPSGYYTLNTKNIKEFG